MARLQRVVRERIQPRLHEFLADVEVSAWRVDGDGEPVPAVRAIGAEYEPMAVGATWGPRWGTTWLRVEGRVPATDQPVELVLDLGWSDRFVGGQGEGLVYRADGVPLKALHPRNVWFR